MSHLKIYLILFFAFLFSSNLIADEVITLKADMDVLKCQDWCVSPIMQGSPVQIHLQQPNENSTTSRGKYSFEKSIEDYTFKGTIAVLKIKNASSTTYLIQAYLFSINGEKSKSQIIGNVVVNDPNNLNNITWRGTFEKNDDKYIVSIMIGK